jgi:hypothetical protein
MTSTQYEYVKFSMEALIIIVAGKDLIVKKDEIWYKRISVAGWILVLLAMGGFLSSILKSNVDDNEKRLTKKQDSIDRISEIKLIIDSLNSQQNLFRYYLNDKKQVVHDTIKNEHPLIFIQSATISQIKKGVEFDTIFYKIRFKNATNFDAYNLKIDFYAYSPLNTIKKITRVEVLNKSVLPKNMWVEYYGSGIFRNNIVAPKDTFYIYIKGHYDNEKYNNLDNILDWKISSDTMFIASPLIYNRVKKEISLLYKVNSQ